jgi:5,10-methylene-tetrahydrofolate dehydrogenase/methenyl tetrahydrofolate cyclohydrolase
MKKVAVQNVLNTISDYLCSEGYTVTEFDNRKKNAGNFYNKYDIVVVTGENQNVMGIEDAISSTTIIDATGMTEQEVKTRIEESNRRK